MRKLLWIGSFVIGDALVEARKRGYGNPASVQSQANLIEGLEHAYGQVFDTIGALVLPSYPKNETKYFKEIVFSHSDVAKDCLVGFDNHEFINRVTSKRNLIRKAKEWAISHTEDSVEVYIYEMRSACLDAAAEVKRIIPSARINLLVPDLPVYMDLRMSRVKSTLKKIDWRHIKNTLGIVNNFILYAEPMVDYLSIRDRSWIVMEGSINHSDIREFSCKDDHSEMFVVMYSGHVEERFGINRLADAFQLLSTGVSMVECCIRIALGEKPDLEPKWSKGSAIRYLKTETGIVKEINGIEQAKMTPGVVQVSIVHGIGEHVGEIKSSVDRAGFVIAQDQNAMKAISDAEAGIEKIEILVSRE